MEDQDVLLDRMNGLLHQKLLQLLLYIALKTLKGSSGAEFGKLPIIFLTAQNLHQLCLLHSTTINHTFFPHQVDILQKLQQVGLIVRWVHVEHINDDQVLLFFGEVEFFVPEVYFYLLLPNNLVECEFFVDFRGGDDAV